LKVREITKLVKKDGWRFKNQEGSHQQYVHPVKQGKVTIVGDPGDDIPEGTLRSILKQAQLTKQDLLKLKKRRS
jgi:predicted RNA binding protein YcfA (HicA-like mRNA interferase family)